VPGPARFWPTCLLLHAIRSPESPRAIYRTGRTNTAIDGCPSVDVDVVSHQPAFRAVATTSRPSILSLIRVARLIPLSDACLVQEWKTSIGTLSPTCLPVPCLRSISNR